MQGTIAQMIALVIYGNRFFQAGDVNDLFSHNSTFKFCRSVTFVEGRLEWRLAESATVVEGRLEWCPAEKESPIHLYAQMPQAWYEKLHTDGVHGVRLHYEPDISPARSRELVAFVGGGGRWLIEAVHDAHSDYWEEQWVPSLQTAPDNRIWDVTYGQIASGVSSSPDQAKTLQPTIDELGRILQSLRAFAEQRALPDFAKCFSTAIETLSASRPLGNVYHNDMAPPGYLSREVEMLLDASQAAWVFGGMGSWNDIGFDGADQKTYETLSDQLYLLLNSAIVQTTNSMPWNRKLFLRFALAAG